MIGTFFLAAALSLDGAWDLDYRIEEEGGEWNRVEATVPCDGYLALQQAGVLPDLTVGTNVWGVLKLEQYEWRFSRTFDAPDVKPGEKAELVFEGVDTRATYTLNGELIGRSDNMFIPHRFDVTKRLKPHGNRIEVRIASPLGRSLLNVLGRSRVGGTDVEGIRKAQHSFGWDIMPRVVCGGIWRSVRIDVLPLERFGDVFWIVERVDAKAKTADVRVQCQVIAPRRRLHEATLRVSLSRDGKVAAECEHPYRYAQTCDGLKVRDAKLWWPRSAGDPILYDAVAELKDQSGRVLAKDVRKVGLRTVRLERADWHSECDPGTFRFIVNGSPVYMHGCDWTPMDALHSRDAQHLRKCLEMLVDLNCNMIRIWGGGVYEADALYDFCDRNGILVWQDFMMGNVEPEQNDDFAKAIEEEAKVQVVRLRSHPSLALWCANNEQDRSVASMWRENAPDPAGDRISREVLPRVLRDFDPFTPYIPSSPWWTPDVVAGKAKLSQDHLWGPRSQYFKGAFWTANTPTFVSETGYHGCPNIESLKRMMTPGCVYPWPDATNRFAFNEEWRCKATVAYPEQGPTAHGDRRNALMPMQSRRMFGSVPDRLEDFVSASQHAQAEALKTWIELSRSKKGRTWGLLWWNLRDGWPILSDGVVDWYFGKKMSYGAIKQSSQDELVMVRDDHKVVAVNDRLRRVGGYVRIFDRESGNVLLEREYKVDANATAVLGEIAWRGQGVLEVEYGVDEEWHRNYYLYGDPPFDFARMDPLLRDVRGEDPVYDGAMGYSSTGRRAVFDGARTAAERVISGGGAVSPRTLCGLVVLSGQVDAETAARYRVFVRGKMAALPDAKKADMFCRKALDGLKGAEAREMGLKKVADRLPAKAGLPKGEFRRRFRVCTNESALEKPAAGRTPCEAVAVMEAEKILSSSIPDASDELYLQYVQNGNRSNYERRWFERQKMFETFVSAEVEEGKGRFLDRIKELLGAFCDQKTWVFPAHDGQLRGRNGNLKGLAQSVDLFSSELAADIVCALSEIGDRLGPELVGRVKGELERRIFAPIRRDIRFFRTQGCDSDAITGGKFQWWIDSDGNWNAVCWDNVVCAALGSIDSRIDRAFFVEGALRSVDHYLSGFAPDGYCVEGMGYWNYGFGHHMRMGLLLRDVSGGFLDIFTRPIQRKVADYARNYELCPGLSPAFADGNGAPSPSNLRLVKQIWPDADGEVGAVSAFPEAQVWLFRATNGYSVAIAGGNNGVPHNHNDIGTYYLVKDGRFVSGDPGSERYTRRTFSEHRYESPMLNSYGHPVPSVGGSLQCEGRQYAAKILSCDLGERTCSVSMEIKGAYNVKTLKSLVRTFSWERNGSLFTVKDHFEFTEPTAFEVPYISYEGAGCKPQVTVVPEGYSIKGEDIPNPDMPLKPRRMAVVPDRPVQSAEVTISFN